MPKRTIRLTDAIDQRVQSAAKLRGYCTPTSLFERRSRKSWRSLERAPRPMRRVWAIYQGSSSERALRGTSPTGLICSGG